MFSGRINSSTNGKRFNNIFFLFFSFYLTTLNVDVGFALKPYMIITFLFILFELSKLKFAFLEINEIFMIIFYFYYMFTIIVSDDKAASLRLFFAIIINLISYFTLRYAFLSLNKNDFEKIISVTGLFYNVISFILYIIGFLYVTVGSRPYGVYFGVLADGGMLRLVGLQGDPNLFVFSNLLFIFYYLTHLEGKNNKLVFSLIILNTLLTISRSGYLTIVILLIFYIFLNYSTAIKNIVILFVFGIVAYGFFYWIFNFNLIELIMTRFGVDNDIDISGGRLGLLESGLQIFKEHPLFGVGIYNSGNAIAGINNKFQVLHNSYLDILVESGIIGILLFTVFIISFLMDLFMALKRNNSGNYVVLSVLGTMIMIGSLSVITSEFLFIYIVISNVFIKKVKYSSKEERMKIE